MKTGLFRCPPWAYTGEHHPDGFCFSGENNTFFGADQEHLIAAVFIYGYVRNSYTGCHNSTCLGFPFDELIKNFLRAHSRDRRRQVGYHAQGLIPCHCPVQVDYRALFHEAVKSVSSGDCLRPHLLNYLSCFLKKLLRPPGDPFEIVRVHHAHLGVKGFSQFSFQVIEPSCRGRSDKIPHERSFLIQDSPGKIPAGQKTFQLLKIVVPVPELDGREHKRNLAIVRQQSRRVLLLPGLGGVSHPAIRLIRHFVHACPVISCQ